MKTKEIEYIIRRTEVNSLRILYKLMNGIELDKGANPKSLSTKGLIKPTGRVNRKIRWEVLPKLFEYKDLIERIINQPKPKIKI